MEREALRLWKLYIQQPRLWTSWDHAKTPIGFHDARQAVLFGHPQAPPEFEKKEAEGVIYHVADPKPLSFTANSSVDLNGIPTATVMWREGEDENFLGLVTHEAFHAYQMVTDCPMGEIAMALKYPVNNAAVQALAEVEANLLSKALQKEGLELVRAALDARKARQTLLSPELVAWEDEAELGEGLATYIEIKSAGPSSQLWESKLSTLPRLNKNAWGADRLRFYYSGMAWALLCDRYADNWQAEEWRTLAEIVAEAISHNPDPDVRNFPDLDFNAVLTRQKWEAEERMQQMENSLAQALPGTGLRVEIHSKSTPVGAGWNPNTAVTFPGVGRFHPTGLMYIFDSGSRLEIKKNCIEKQYCRHIVFERRGLNVRLNGEPLSQGSSLGSLEIAGEDCIVNIPKAKVKFSGNILIAEDVAN